FNAGTNPSSLTGASGQSGDGLVIISFIPSIRYVKQDGTGDGSSWQQASGDLQAMINAEGVEQVWVAQGTYKPGGAANTSRSLSFAMKNAVAIYGGFPATGDPGLNDRNPANNVTTLSGDLGGPGTSDNSYNVIRNPSGLTRSALLDGFVITGGNATGGATYGGALRESAGNTTSFTNCRFEANHGRGAGAISVNGSSIVVTNCLFANNTADDLGGGAVRMELGSPSLINCVFLNNSSTARGGAVSIEYIGGPITARLTNCSFRGNTASQGGAIYKEAGAVGMLANCAVFDNGGSNTFSNTSTGTLQVSSSLLESTVTGYTSDPSNLTTTTSPFVSATDLRLNGCSAAINAGSNEAYTQAGGSQTDLAGQPRFYPSESRIDIGAYEYQASPTSITITNPSTPTAAVGVSFSRSFSASGGQGTYSFSVVSSSLPVELTLSEQGALTGTPTQAGSYSLTVQAQDGQGCTGLSSPYSLTVSNPTPTITDFGASPSPVCAGSPVTFTATVGNYSGGYSYTLTNGVDTPLSGSLTSGAFSQSLTASGSASQSYTLLVSSQGTQATATTGLSVNPTLSVSLNNNGSLSCERTSARLAVPSVGNNATYVFSGPFPVSQPTGTSSRTATVSNPGEYTVLVTNAQGCTATATTLVEANTDPPRNLSLTVSNVITCAQPTAVLDASANNNPGFVITGPGGQSYSANTATVSQPGEYTLTATRNNGCIATRTVTVESNTTPPQNVSLTNNGPLTCSQTSVNLSASSSTTGVAYGITGPDGFSASGGTTSVNRPGTYTLIVTGTNGCSATTTTTVESNTITPSVSLTNSGPLSFTNASVTLTATATPGDNLSYTFSSNAAQQGSSNKASVTTAGVYSVTVTRQDNGCSAVASTTVLGGNNPTVCRGGTAVISVAVSGAPVKYEWYKNSLTSPKLMETPQLFRGTATSSLTLINAQSNTQGNFYLKTTDQAGVVTIYGPYRLTVDGSCRAREVAQPELLLQVELAPNPIQQDRLRAVIRGAEGRPLQVELINLQGHLVRQQKWQQANDQHSIDWDLQGQSNGLYLLQVISEGGAGLPAQRQSVKVV
ncbi:putative Ig domain-containing protein, partial [Spirosoma fluminis]